MYAGAKAGLRPIHDALIDLGDIDPTVATGLNRAYQRDV